MPSLSSPSRLPTYANHCPPGKSGAAMTATVAELPEAIIMQTSAMPDTPKLPQEGVEAIITLYFIGVGVCFALTATTLFHITSVIRKGMNRKD